MSIAFPPKPCACCGKPFSREKGEKAQNFRKRKFCERACQYAARMKPRQTKTCQRCGVEFKRPDKLPIHRFEKRQFCGPVCSRAASLGRILYPTPPKHPCPACGADLVRRARESRKDFIDRKYCNQRCAGKIAGRRLPLRAFNAHQLSGHTVKQLHILKQSPVSRKEADRLIEEFLAKREPTRCPTKFVAESVHARPDEPIIAQRIKGLKTKGNDSWKAIAKRTAKAMGRTA